jgi:hypothetical protein
VLRHGIPFLHRCARRRRGRRLDGTHHHRLRRLPAIDCRGSTRALKQRGAKPLLIKTSAASVSMIPASMATFRRSRSRISFPRLSHESLRSEVWKNFPRVKRIGLRALPLSRGACIHAPGNGTTALSSPAQVLSRRRSGFRDRFWMGVEVDRPSSCLYGLRYIAREFSGRDGHGRMFLAGARWCSPRRPSPGRALQPA